MHPAGYKLTVGNEFYLEGKFYRLPSFSDALSDEQRPCVEIPPFQVAVLKTAETICMPRFLIGRWNIVVKMAYRGLLWVGGAQVDPGYIGHFFARSTTCQGKASD
jgi:deoxycytidine triphosphate deaminase